MESVRRSSAQAAPREPRHDQSYMNVLIERAAESDGGVPQGQCRNRRSELLWNDMHDATRESLQSEARLREPRAIADDIFDAVHARFIEQGIDSTPQQVASAFRNEFRKRYLGRQADNFTESPLSLAKSKMEFVEHPTIGRSLSTEQQVWALLNQRVAEHNNIVAA